jgi:hypothetical protein
LIRHFALKHIVSDAKDAEVTPVRAINEIAQAAFDDAGAEGDKPNVG